jgi:hypothetical protein
MAARAGYVKVNDYQNTKCKVGGREGSDALTIWSMSMHCQCHMLIGPFMEHHAFLIFTILTVTSPHLHAQCAISIFRKESVY